MDGQDWWIECGGDEPIRQGDVIRRVDTATGTTEWRLVVTADCDIAQRKSGERLTWLAMISAGAYLRTKWAPEQLRRLGARQTRAALEALNGKLRQSAPDLAPLTEESLRRWLDEHPPEAVLRAVAPGKPAEPKLLGGLHALRIIAGRAGPADPLAALLAAWTASGRGRNQQETTIREAFEGDRGFPDFFLLPDLPTGEAYGHVVLLREISSVDAADVFPSELEARLADRPDAFHRVTRLHDGVRFAITQKLAFLFSRIGMTVAFETACGSATDLILEAIPWEEAA